jgi:hypothetical protein
MTEKKSVLLLASAAALTLVLHETALSAPPENESVPTATAQTATPAPSMPTAAEGQTPGPAPAFPESTGTGQAAPEPEGTKAAPPSPQSTAPETESSEVPKPPPPLEMPMAGTGGDQSRIMTPEERNALREQRFQRMHERFMQRRQEITERWNSYWKMLDEMTPEQKEAIEAVFGSRKRPCSHRAMGRQMPPGMTMQPPMGQPQYGFPSGSTFPGPGYGYGPQRPEPYPSEMGPGASWLGEPPMYPGSAQPWRGTDEGSFQGPPPPGGEYNQP